MTEKTKHRTSIGGQAVLEGVMMRGARSAAIAVRKPDGTIEARTLAVSSVKDRHPVLKLPVLRGVVNFVEMLSFGYKSLNFSAQLAGIEEEESRFEKWLAKRFGGSLVNGVVYISLVLGLLLAARGDDAGAITEFKSAIYSLTSGFTRTNFELARLYLRARRPRDAIAVLQPTLRAPLESSNLYLARTDAHELLAEAWDSAGVRDSAAVHYAWVAKAWAAADSPYAARARSARNQSATKS
jgi:hypothetical protein